MAELSFDNIMSGEEIENLFVDMDETEETPAVDETTVDDENIKKDTTEVVNVDTLFASEEPESVGSEDEENQDAEKGTTSGEDGSSPKSNFYSSIAKALQEEGIFPDLDDGAVKKIATPEDFAHMIETTIQSKFDARQKRIDSALNANVEVSDIKKYENTLNYLDSIGDDIITEEGEQGETLRKQLIFQDFVNRGYSQERAQREVTKSLNAGTDIEDAKEALKSNKEFCEQSYNSLVEEAKKEEERIIKERKEQGEKLKKSILEDKKVFGEIQLDKVTRQKIFEPRIHFRPQIFIIAHC